MANVFFVYEKDGEYHILGTPKDHAERASMSIGGPPVENFEDYRFISGPHDSYQLAESSIPDEVR